MDNIAYLEELYLQWKKKRDSVDVQWDNLFGGNISALYKNGTFKPAEAPFTNGLATTSVTPLTANRALNRNYQSVLQSKVERMIWAYRYRGYLYANLNPLGNYSTPDLKYIFYTIEGLGNRLDASQFGIGKEDMDREVFTGGYINPSTMRVSDLIVHLKRVYCSTMGVETLHIRNKTVRRWVINKIESIQYDSEWSKPQRIRFQKDLIKAEEFERFIHANFIGQKRFSLEGSEVLIPALRYLVDSSHAHGIEEIVLGMAHRGRLNVFTNALRKPCSDTIADFLGSYQPYIYGGSGDVKYHLGHSFEIELSEGKKMHISLVANPSHLEAVNPVVEGKCRGIQRRRGDKHRKRVVPVLIHGDASFSGQGIVTETFNLSLLRGYRTGGTIHIILNNQIGFTTASRDSRSTFFPSDLAKILPIPIIHVNGDDPEATVRAVALAISYRQKFSFDVLIDIVCYRRLGHNEADEPSYTHPLMYSLIKDRQTVRQRYGQKLTDNGAFPLDEQKAFSAKYITVLKEEMVKVKNGHQPSINNAFQSGEWQNFKSEYSFTPVETTVARKTIEKVATVLCRIPDDFALHPKIARIINDRATVIANDGELDWAFAESLAFGTLLLENYAIRLSGEDSARGTFSQRHAVWWDTKSQTPKMHIPLQHIAEQQADFSVYDSPLSEFSVLGFDYGYSLAQPNILVLWEAQFGDFVNGAQVIIDQFIAAAQTKWYRSSGLVMLLPHGYEGQGPEHSSAHLERFLQLCAEDNLQVVNPSTPAQYFHLLRRQMKQSFRKPLIVMTPKSHLRSQECRSTVADLAQGSFQLLLDDTDCNSSMVRHILITSGHHYYTLQRERLKQKINDIAIIRLEQYYPFPRQHLKTLLQRYPTSATVIYCQEESFNRGAYNFVAPYINDQLSELGFSPLKVVARPASASPATGSFPQHSEELAQIIERALLNS